MVDDPYTYDLTDFAREFTWSLLFWNSAEISARQMLVEMLGGGVAATAIVCDMGNRSILEGIEAAGRELEDQELRSHLAHFSKGFGVLLGYRNFYVHGLSAVLVGETIGLNRKLVGHAMQLKASGRLKSVQRTIDMNEIITFKAHVLTLSRYASAILTALGMDDFGISEMLGTSPPSLEKPSWPTGLQNTPSYLQE